MLCHCMNERLEQIKLMVIEDLPKHDPESLQVNWVGKVFRFDGSKNDVMLPVNIKYRMIKTNGDPHKNKTEKTMSMAMSYCPLCGEKYEAA